MHTNTHIRSLSCAALLALGLVGCGDDAKTGQMSLAVTDAPVDGVVSVVVTFNGVEMQPHDGARVDVTYDTPRQIDLLALQGGLSAPLLEGLEVPAGDYSWIRLKVGTAPGSTESFVQLLDGSIHPLVVPSGDQTGLKLHGGVTVAAGGSAAFTVDFDLRKSLHLPQNGSGDYRLRPTLRLVDDLAVGTLMGAVDPALLTVGCTPAVYVYAGASVTPDDVGGSGAQPITSAQATTTYAVGFLAAGDYTVAFTCAAAADAPEVDDAIAFAVVANATIVAGQTTTLDLVAPPP